MEGLSIAAMTAEDIGALAELETLCFSTPWSAGSLAAELAKEQAVFLVARSGTGALCGYAGMNYLLDEGYIANLAVHPDYRRQGIGAALLRGLLSHCEALELRFVSLEVRANNAAAIALYRSFNFINVGKRRRFYQDPEDDAVIMTKFFQDKEV